MSLLVSGNKIYIQNPDGTEKFNSDNKLLYKKYVATGSISMPSRYGAQVRGISLDTQFNGARDLPLIYITPTSSSGNVASQVIGSTIQLNFAMLLNFEHSNTEARVVRYDVLTAMYNNFQLEFALTPYQVWQWNNPDYNVSSCSISFDWKLVLLSYR